MFLFPALVVYANFKMCIKSSAGNAAISKLINAAIPYEHVWSPLFPVSWLQIQISHWKGLKGHWGNELGLTAKLIKAHWKHFVLLASPLHTPHQGTVFVLHLSLLLFLLIFVIFDWNECGKCKPHVWTVQKIQFLLYCKKLHSKQ